MARMLEDDDMRAIFFDPEVFGETVTIAPNGADGFTVAGIYDRHPLLNPVGLAKAQVGFKDGMMNTGNSPQFQCREIDVSGVKAGRATLKRANGETFNVWDVKPDGTGMTLLTLKVA